MILKSSTDEKMEIFLRNKFIEISLSDLSLGCFFIAICTSEAIPVQLPNLPILYHHSSWLSITFSQKAVRKLIWEFSYYSPLFALPLCTQVKQTHLLKALKPILFPFSFIIFHNEVYYFYRFQSC